MCSAKDMSLSAPRDRMKVAVSPAGGESHVGIISCGLGGPEHGTVLSADSTTRQYGNWATSTGSTLSSRCPLPAETRLGDLTWPAGRKEAKKAVGPKRRGMEGRIEVGEPDGCG